jgi:pyrroline-5-carboxylate reductase
MSLRLAGPLLLVGAGKMGGALLFGWLREGLNPASIFVQDPEPSKEAAALLRRHKIAKSVRKLAKQPAVIVLAVKPQLVDAVLPGLKPLIGGKTVLLSIAAGRTLKGLSKHLPEATAVVRAMPNTPAAIGQGISVAIANAAVTATQRRDCNALLEAGGEVIWIDDEALMDPVTAVSGSGPAYVFLLAESLAEAGVEAGLERKLATRLACATVSGAGELLRRSGLSPSELRENVTSPKGTTAAALEELMVEKGLKHLLSRAVAAAKKRSRELSS